MAPTNVEQIKTPGIRLKQAPQADRNLHAFAPVCRDLERHRPGGYVSIKGKFVKKHKDDLLALIKGTEERACAEESSHKIVVLREKPRKLQVTTTCAHLAREIGKALEQAFYGKTDYSFCKTNHLLRVRWHRD